MFLWGTGASLQVARAFNGGTFRFLSPTRQDLRHGFGFVFVQTSANGQTDIDKVVLEANGLTVDTANYAPGFRIAEMATIPLIALVRATYAEFFRRGQSTISASMAFARKLTQFSAVYGVLAGLGYSFSPHSSRLSSTRAN